MCHTITVRQGSCDIYVGISSRLNDENLTSLDKVTTLGPGNKFRSQLCF